MLCACAPDSVPEGFSDADLVHMRRLRERVFNATTTNNNNTNTTNNKSKEQRTLTKHDIVVFDPSGEWLSQWHKSFRALNIAHLRSVSRCQHHT